MDCGGKQSIDELYLLAIFAIQPHKTNTLPGGDMFVLPLAMSR